MNVMRWAPTTCNRLSFKTMQRLLCHRPARPSFGTKVFQSTTSSRPAIFSPGADLSFSRANDILRSRPRMMTTDAKSAGESENLSEGKRPYGIGSVVRADLNEVLELLDEKKAADVVVLDSHTLPNLAPLCRQMIILTCTSRRHMKIVADHVTEHFKLKGMLLEVEDEEGRTVLRPPSIEGEDSDCWMLVDLGDIIVQILTREGRETYRLEEHWRAVCDAEKAGIPYEQYIDQKGLHKLHSPPEV